MFTSLRTPNSAEEFAQPHFDSTLGQAQSHHAENPSLDLGSFAVCRIKRRVGVCGERAVTVRLSHPCDYRVSVVLVAVAIFLRKTPAPQCRVDFGHDRLSAGKSQPSNGQK
jgi:hypothetical protein